MYASVSLRGICNLPLLFCKPVLIFGRCDGIFLGGQVIGLCWRRLHTWNYSIQGTETLKHNLPPNITLQSIIKRLTGNANATGHLFFWFHIDYSHSHFCLFLPYHFEKPTNCAVALNQQPYINCNQNAKEEGLVSYAKSLMAALIWWELKNDTMLLEQDHMALYVICDW